MRRGAWAQTARQLAAPGLMLQALAIGAVVAYYFLAPWRQWLTELSAWRAEFGLGFSLVSTALCGGLFPFAYLHARADTRAANPMRHLWFHLSFWGYKGLEVDLFYRFQAWLFGGRPGVATVFRKVFLDQMVYTPFWSIPIMLIAYRWKEAGFQSAGFFRTDWRLLARQAYPPAVLSCWLVWIPAVAAVYSLPLPLQIPLFNLELCFWTLLFTRLTQPGETASGRIAVKVV